MEHETPTTKDVWVRVAGNVKRIRTAGDPFHWRCFIAIEQPEVPLRSYELFGQADGKNMRVGTDPAAANPLGLSAWIDFYGDVTIEDGIARITLKPR